jgi:hypothetical protein
MPFMPKPLTALVSWNVHQFAPLNDDYPKDKNFHGHLLWDTMNIVEA